VRLRLQRREIALLAVLAVTAFLALWPQLRGTGDAPVVVSSGRQMAMLPAVPRIDLERIEEEPDQVEVGRRDLFAYGPAKRTAEVEAPPPTPSAPVIRTEEPPAADAAAAASVPGATRPSLPPLNLKFIGSVGNERGVQVAVLVTERNEVLTGQPGDIIANRYRIERIGIESVDLEDVGTGQSRRIPLKGN
jgi:hypothetical protein